MHHVRLVSGAHFCCILFVVVLVHLPASRLTAGVDSAAPVPRYTMFDADEFAKGTVTDMPVDAAVRSNLQSIELIGVDSRNCTLKIGPLTPGVTDITSWSVIRTMSLDPAFASVRFRDAVGNDTVIGVIAKPLTKPQLTINASARICVGMSRQIASVTKASSYLWNTGDTTAQIVVSPLVSTKYVLRAKNSHGEEFQSDSILITVSTFPDPLLRRSGDTLYVDSTVTALYVQWFCDGVALTAATQRTLVATKAGMYKVTVTNTDLCRQTSNVVAVTGLSAIHSDTAAWQDVYPLPVEDILNLETRSHQFTQAEIIDSRGENVMSKIIVQPAEHIELDVRSLAAGQYTLVLVGLHSTTTRSFIKR